MSDSSTSITSSSPEWEEEWEEWDGKSPFWTHCVAGSLAGLTEHALVYPLDTVRTHIQVCAACRPSTNSFSKTVSGKKLVRAVPHQQLPLGMWQTMRHLVSSPTVVHPQDAAPSGRGMMRLWRGVQTVLFGCIPAHALYFSSYEAVKAATLDSQGQVTTYGSMLSGAVAVLCHDMIMAPLDTVKQRMQLGHYQGVGQAISKMMEVEGSVSLYRSFPITLATNVPYGMVMVGTNEFLKQKLTPEDERLTLKTTLVSSSVAGLLAAAITTPLDRIKTSLQVQQLAPCDFKLSSTSKVNCPYSQKSEPVVRHGLQAVEQILEREGMVGFFRGLTPRILSHTPAAAISWTTYETAKQYLQTNF